MWSEVGALQGLRICSEWWVTWACGIIKNNHDFKERMLKLWKSMDPWSWRGSLDISSFCSTFPVRERDSYPSGEWYSSSRRSRMSDLLISHLPCPSQTSSFHYHIPKSSSPATPAERRYCNTPTRALAIVPGPEDDATGVLFELLFTYICFSILSCSPK